MIANLNFTAQSSAANGMDQRLSDVVRSGGEWATRRRVRSDHPGVAKRSQPWRYVHVAGTRWY